MNTAKDISAAVGAWTEILGAENVTVEASILDRYARTTQVRGTRPDCVLYPATTMEVQEVVRVAAAHGVSLYPISRGKNWGYGDACAPAEGAAIVDLRRMNRIVEVSTELAYTVIEPGVTQQQLHDHLREHDTGLWLDCTGAGPDASLVGNTLDHGFGHTRYGDHFATTCGMEIVLADGRVLHTGFGHDPRAIASRVYPYGVGPFLDGLFCQSNFGIVTKIGLWLMPAPEAFNFFYIRLHRPEDIGEFIDRVRPLRMRGLINTALHTANDLRLVSARRGFPFDEADGRTALSGALRTRLRNEAGVSPWIACGSLSGTRAQVRGTRRALRRALHPLARPKFVDDRFMAVADWGTRLLGLFGLGAHLAEQFGTLKPNYSLLKGTPTADPLRGTHWRLRTPPADPEADPLDVGAGIIWISPVLPMTGRDAQAVIDIATPLFASFEFEPLITFTMINERAMIAILNLAFDQAVPEEARRAADCYDALMTALLDAGYVPYRTGPAGMAKLRRDDVFWDVAKQLKKALDPQDIIAPGRYVPPLDESR